MLAITAGCFTSPVAPPSGLPVDSALLGRWECVSPEPGTEERAELEVRRADEQHYEAVWKEEGKADRYRAYLVRLAGVTVLSVGDAVPSKGSTWTAVRYAVEQDGALVLRVPAKRILDMADEKAAILELRTKADQPETWQPFARCTRR